MREHLKETVYESEGCPMCRALRVRKEEKEEKFLYGVGEPVELTATIPVWTCEVCDFSWSDTQGEERQHEAVCRHLKVMTPAEIRTGREGRGLSLEGLAELSGYV